MLELEKLKSEIDSLAKQVSEIRDSL